MLKLMRLFSLFPYLGFIMLCTGSSPTWIFGVGMLRKFNFIQCIFLLVKSIISSALSKTHNFLLNPFSGAYYITKDFESLLRAGGQGPGSNFHFRNIGLHRLCITQTFKWALRAQRHPQLCNSQFESMRQKLKYMLKTWLLYKKNNRLLNNIIKINA